MLCSGACRLRPVKDALDRQRRGAQPLDLPVVVDEQGLVSRWVMPFRLADPLVRHRGRAGPAEPRLQPRRTPVQDGRSRGGTDPQNASLAHGARPSDASPARLPTSRQTTFFTVVKGALRAPGAAVLVHPAVGGCRQWQRRRAACTRADGHSAPGTLALTGPAAVRLSALTAHGGRPTEPQPRHCPSAAGARTNPPGPQARAAPRPCGSPPPALGLPIPGAIHCHGGLPQPLTEPGRPFNPAPIGGWGRTGQV